MCTYMCCIVVWTLCKAVSGIDGAFVSVLLDVSMTTIVTVEFVE